MYVCSKMSWSTGSHYEDDWQCTFCWRFEGSAIQRDAELVSLSIRSRLDISAE